MINIEYREEKDKKTTSSEHGFALTGICLKDPVTGEIKEKHHKLYPPIEETKEWIARLFK